MRWPLITRRTHERELTAARRHHREQEAYLTRQHVQELGVVKRKLHDLSWWVDERLSPVRCNTLASSDEMMAPDIRPLLYRHHDDHVIYVRVSNQLLGELARDQRLWEIVGDKLHHAVLQFARGGTS